MVQSAFGDEIDPEKRRLMYEAAQQPKCGKCGKVMTPQNASIRPELFLHDDCLPDELKPQTPTTASQESPGPQTHEEARQFHEGFLSGLTVYARERGDSTLKSKNELLRRLMDEQGWKTIETFEKLGEDLRNLPELTAEERAAMNALPKDFIERILRGERPVTDPTTFAN